MNRRQNFAIVALFALLAGLSVWLQFGLLARPGGAAAGAAGDRPDYYIEGFVSTGIDRLGEQYRVSAERLTHYPRGARALLHRPYIVQYRNQGAPRHIYADSGWLYDNHAEVQLSGNVRVVENASGDLGGAVATARTMTVRLGEGRR